MYRGPQVSPIEMRKTFGLGGRFYKVWGVSLWFADSGFKERSTKTASWKQCKV